MYQLRWAVIWLCFYTVIQNIQYLRPLRNQIYLIVDRFWTIYNFLPNFWKNLDFKACLVLVTARYWRNRFSRLVKVDKIILIVKVYIPVVVKSLTFWHKFRMRKKKNVFKTKGKNQMVIVNMFENIIVNLLSKSFNRIHFDCFALYKVMKNVFMHSFTTIFSLDLLLVLNDYIFTLCYYI